jgi:hypothetical protein
MTKSPYKRFSRVLRRHSALIVATVALVVALVGVPGVTAGGLLVTSKNVKNNSLTSADIKKATLKTSDIGTNAVRSADIQSGAVESSDIGSGEVTPEDVTMPDPSQIKYDGTARIDLATDDLAFHKVVDLGSYPKTDPASDLEVTWTGSVEGRNGADLSGCVFQLRVDGSPAPSGGGEVFGKGVVSVSSSALFPALPAGPHSIEVWAKVNIGGTVENSCTVGPAKAGVGQTAVVQEIVS